MKFTAVFVSMTLIGTTLQAQDAYVGVSLDYGMAQSDDNQTAASLLAGGSYDLGAFSVGAEAEYGASATFGGDYDTARLRLMGGYEFRSLTAIATLGGSRFDDGDAAVTGYNFGLGVQAPITDSLDIRGEVIRDIMDDSDFNTTTSRVAAVYSF